VVLRLTLSTALLTFDACDASSLCPFVTDLAVELTFEASVLQSAFHCAGEGATAECKGAVNKPTSAGHVIDNTRRGGWSNDVQLVVSGVWEKRICGTVESNQ
jgi:hypothetical protein